MNVLFPFQTVDELGTEKLYGGAPLSLSRPNWEDFEAIAVGECLRSQIYASRTPGARGLFLVSEAARLGPLLPAEGVVGSEFV